MKVQHTFIRAATVLLITGSTLAGLPGAAMAQGEVESAAAAYGLGKQIATDIASLASGPSQCVRHIYNRSNAVWFVKSSAIGSDGTLEIPIRPSQTAPVFYNGNGGPVEITGPDYHDMFNAKGCRLDHNGRTGRAVLNDPADGDIVFIN